MVVMYSRYALLNDFFFLNTNKTQYNLVSDFQFSMSSVCEINYRKQQQQKITSFKEIFLIYVCISELISNISLIIFFQPPGFPPQPQHGFQPMHQAPKQPNFGRKIAPQQHPTSNNFTLSMAAPQKKWTNSLLVTESVDNNVGIIAPSPDNISGADLESPPSTINDQTKALLYTSAEVDK